MVYSPWDFIPQEFTIKGVAKMKTPFNRFGTMLDCSRNAVMNVKSVKNWIDMTSDLGFNMLMLYTEDTYEVENQPRFGYLRGRYTMDEIKELDAYAESRGVELIPCIQTLGHLNQIFHWSEYSQINDIDDILLAGDEKTYKLIDDMLDTCSANFRSRKINLGMDEAMLLGSGNYLSKNGYKPRSEIMKEHLDVVVRKCRDRGLEPMIWSDMFFHMIPPGGYYRMSIDEMPEEIVNIVPGSSGRS